MCVQKISQLINKTGIVRSKELLHSEKNKGWGIQPWRSSIGVFKIHFTKYNKISRFEAWCCFAVIPYLMEALGC